MWLFGSKGRKAGWFCVNLMPDRVDVCHVLAAGKERPEILLCDSYRKEGGDIATPVAPLTSTTPPLICLLAWRPERFESRAVTAV